MNQPAGANDRTTRSPASHHQRGSYAGLTSLCGAGVIVAACLAGVIPTLRHLADGRPLLLSLPWDAAHGRFLIGLDPLSAFFLLPVLVLSAVCAVYSASYAQVYRRHKSLAVYWIFLTAFVAGMVMVLIARTVFLCVASWELMSLSAYFLVAFEHEQRAARRAGWIYLVATHLGVAFLLAALLLLARQAGSLEFGAFALMPPLGVKQAGIIFVLALIGFGAKAGFVPFHIWLPEAHPAAPSPVSALMSGVMIKMGFYGLLRVVSFIGSPAPWWGATLGAVGLATALVGIALALHQRDIKRTLAYSSIENVGLIALALGFSLFASATGLPGLATLGASAALLHIWNHSLIKGLMFLVAGSIVHGTGTKDIEKLGGVCQGMPWTAGAMVVGSVAIAALPPLNGFAGKWLIYLSLMRYGLATGGVRGLTALLAVGLVALVGGLAGIAFVRLTGIAVLGSPRTDAARNAHESSRSMLVPMACLVALCLLGATFPARLVRLLPGVVGEVLGRTTGDAWADIESSGVPIATLGVVNAWIMAALGLTGVAVIALIRNGVSRRAPTWGCGYVAPTARMQYTGASFAEMTAENLLPKLLRPRTKRRIPRGPFPSESAFGQSHPDLFASGMYAPFFRRWADQLARLHILQQGSVNVYLLYIVIMVVLALAWVSVRGYWIAS